MKGRHSRACRKDPRRMAADDRVDNRERTSLGCRSTRRASKLQGWSDRFVSPPHAQRLTGGRGVRQNARGRACSPNPVARFEVCLPLSALLAFQITLAAAEGNISALRLPAVPLVTHDPYFSIWSPADKLTDQN